MRAEWRVLRIMKRLKKAIGTAALLGLLIGIISHEIVYQHANYYLWFSLAGAIPGLYLLRALIKRRLIAMHVIESDDREKTSGENLVF